MAISKIIYKTSPQDTGTVWMDATPATATASDITAPKTAMLADGVMTTGTGSGGGGGPLTLLLDDEVDISTTSTTAVEVKSYSLTFDDDRPNTAYLFLIYDKAGVRTGYFNRSVQTCLVGAVGTPRPSIYGNNSYAVTATAYGVYLELNTAKGPRLVARYNANYGTIDGTYVVKIYAVDLTALM